MRTAIALADQGGIESLSMRKLGEELGVEAMSLYNHVDGKEDLLEGIADLVLSEIVWPTDEADWKKAMRQRAISAHHVLLRHFWAAALIESRASNSAVRSGYADAVLECLRRAGFSVEMAYKAMLLMDSYVYGFTLQEVSWVFEPDEAAVRVSQLRSQVSASQYPRLVEVMGYFVRSKTGVAAPRGSGRSGYESEFEFGLDLILEGLERKKNRR